MNDLAYLFDSDYHYVDLLYFENTIYCGRSSHGERGLKLARLAHRCTSVGVAPRMGSAD